MLGHKDQEFGDYCSTWNILSYEVINGLTIWDKKLLWKYIHEQSTRVQCNCGDGVQHSPIRLGKHLENSVDTISHVVLFQIQWSRL